MNNDTAEALRLDQESQVSFSQLVILSGLSDDDLRELVDHGALTPVDPDASSWMFTSYCVVVARMPPSPWIGSTRMPAVSSSIMSRTTLVLLSGACL